MMARPTGGAVANPGAGGIYGQYNGGFGGNVGWGLISDGVYSSTPGTSVELTTTWGVNAAYEHFWTKRWQTSLYGAYISSKYSANANAYLCAAELFALANGCNNNWQYFDIGSRTQFNVDSQTYIGLDVIYTELKAGSTGAPGDTSPDRARSRKRFATLRTRARGWRSSASIATSIPDRLIKVKFA